MRPHVPRPQLRHVIGSVVLAVPSLGIAAATGWHTQTHPGAGAHPLGVLGYLLIVAECVALAWRRLAPTVVLLIVFTLESTYTLLGYAPGGVYFPLITAFAMAMVYGNRRVTYGVLAAGYLIAVQPGFGHTSLTFQVALASWLAALAAFTEIARIRQRVRRAEAQEAERALEAARESARRRAGEERLRIARDLHDVLAHHLALITVQANAGLITLGRDAERTEAALRAIKDSGNTALGELRSVLDLLRAGQDETAPRDPTPVLSRDGDLARLVDGARAAGLSVRIRTLGTPRPLPGPVDRAGYRIVQEALTNAVRHAGPGTSVDVRIGFAQDELRLFVDDDGQGTAVVRDTASPADSAGGGNGLPGMRERVATLGGTLNAEPTVRGGFLVGAVIPTTGQTIPTRTDPEPT